MASDPTAVAPRTFDEVSRVVSATTGDDETAVAYAEISADWTIAGHPNGGYLLAVLARSAPRPEHLPHVVAASAHYLRSPDPGPVELRTEVVRAGRSAGHVRATLAQDGVRCVEALLTLGRLPEEAATEWDGGHLPTPPENRDASTRIEPDPAVIDVPLFDQVEARLDPAGTAALSGAPSGSGELRGWLHLPGDEPFTPASLLFAVDAFPPATVDIRRVGWVPTLQLSAYVRAVPAPGPVRILQRAQLLAGGRLDEVCLVWDSTGRLVAQATQLAVVPSD
jgi:hypothetical protein